MIRLQEVFCFFFVLCVPEKFWHEQSEFQPDNKFLACGNIKAIVKYSWSLKKYQALKLERVFCVTRIKKKTNSF